MSSCRDCHQRIVFVRIENTGNPLPVDPFPDPDGNVYARRHGGAGLLGHVAHKGEQLPDGWRVYMPHHATCPSRTVREEPPAVPESQPEPELTLFDQPN